MPKAIAVLTEPQQRSLEITLQAMEHLVARSRSLRAMAERGGDSGVLVQWNVHLSDRQRTDLETLEAQTLKQLLALRDAFALNTAHENVRHQLHSAFLLARADLEDAKPDKMQGYGGFSPAASAVLDSGIEVLVELSGAFAATLEDEES